MPRSMTPDHVYRIMGHRRSRRGGRSELTLASADSHPLPLFPRLTSPLFLLCPDLERKSNEGRERTDEVCEEEAEENDESRDVRRERMCRSRAGARREREGELEQERGSLREIKE